MDKEQKGQALTREEVLAIKSKLPGWEVAWAKLCVLLLGEDGESGALVGAVYRLPIHWPGGDNDRDEFICVRMSQYHVRAYLGTLLANFDPDKGDVVAYLTAPRELFLAAIRYLRGRTILLSISEVTSTTDDPESGHSWEPPSPSRPSAKFDRWIALANRVIASLSLKRTQSLKHSRNPDSGLTRIEEQAGLQLFPRLTWTRANLVPLREHLQAVVHPSPPRAEPFDELAHVHAAAESNFLRKLNDLSGKVWSKDKGVKLNPKNRERLEARYSALLFDMVFLPLSGKVLVQLLEIAPLDAAQRRSRYRRALPRLLPRLGVLHEALKRQREADQSRRTP